MHVPSTSYSSQAFAGPSGTASDVSESQDPTSEADKAAETIVFEGYYIGQMEMGADASTVANYLDSHQGWFTRCAEPMDVEPIGRNGYAISLGRFGSLNFELEPKIGLHLLPQDRGVYRIETIPVPNHEPQGYDVDFRAAMSLTENQQPDVIAATHVEWELNLQTRVQLPRFIQALPPAVVKASGDRLLNQVVRQISKRLTRKVQEDFHTTMNLPLPRRAWFKR